MTPAPENTKQIAEQKKQPAQICCIGGGKGGIGKSVLSLNMAHALATSGLDVVLADMDLGGANIHTLAGIHNPKKSLRDFFGGVVKDLNELLVVPEDLGFSVLPGSKEVAGVVQPGYQRKLKLLRHLRGLNTHVVVCDLGGNSNLDTLDLFNLADIALIVTSPEPTSIQNAYGFIKASILRKIWQQAGKGSIARELIDTMWDPTKEEIGLAIDELVALAKKRDSDQARLIRKIVASARFEMIVNMADVDEARVTYQSLSGVMRKFLGIQVNFLGFIESDDRIHKRIMRGIPPLIGEELFNPRMWQELLNRFEPATAVGINEEIRVGEDILHVQTEDLGRNTAAYHTLVYSGGRILLSKRVAYQSPFLERAESDSKTERVSYLHRTVVQALRSGRINLHKQADNEENQANSGVGNANN